MINKQELCKMEKEKLVNIIKLLREGFSPFELIDKYDYDSAEVYLCVELISVFKNKKTEKQKLIISY